MVVSVWCGNGKPTPLNDFLDPFVKELDHLLENGLQVNGSQVNIGVLFSSFVLKR